MTLPAGAHDLLRDGVLCYLAASTRHGPHCTPVVFVYEDGALWATTSRRAAKVRAWRRAPAAAALVRHGDRALTLRGDVTLHDLLDPQTWGGSLAQAPALVRASARFTLKNARFFAGYARDAHRVPFAWTPPARIVVGVHPEAGALLGPETVEPWGSDTDASAELASRPRYRATRRRALELPDDAAPEPEGAGVLALAGGRGLTTLPVRYRRRAGAFLCALPESHLALAGTSATLRATLVVDRASSWRASAMRGCMLQGDAEVFVPRELEDGDSQLVRDAHPEPGEAVIRLQPDRAAWWSGWASGTVGGR